MIDTGSNINEFQINYVEKSQTGGKKKYIMNDSNDAKVLGNGKSIMTNCKSVVAWR